MLENCKEPNFYSIIKKYPSQILTLTGLNIELNDSAVYIATIILSLLSNSNNGVQFHGEYICLFFLSLWFRDKHIKTEDFLSKMQNILAKNDKISQNKFGNDLLRVLLEFIVKDTKFPDDLILNKDRSLLFCILYAVFVFRFSIKMSLDFDSVVLLEIISKNLSDIFGFFTGEKKFDYCEYSNSRAELEEYLSATGALTNSIRDVFSKMKMANISSE